MTIVYVEHEFWRPGDLVFSAPAPNTVPDSISASIISINIGAPSMYLTISVEEIKDYLAVGVACLQSPIKYYILTPTCEVILRLRSSSTYYALSSLFRV